jgi:hypothetical protein
MGQWSEIIGEQTLIANETVVAWRNWRCETGETFRKWTHLTSFSLLSLTIQQLLHGPTRKAFGMRPLSLPPPEDTRAWTLRLLLFGMRNARTKACSFVGIVLGKH